MKIMNLLIAGLLSSMKTISENSLSQGNHRIGMKYRYRRWGNQRAKGKRDISMRSRANRRKAKRCA